ncbi:uncharacterized protein LOC120329822 [Styela clava]
MLGSIALVGVFAVVFCGATSEPIAQEEGVDCSPPFWHAKLGDNYPLAGISKRSRPKFRLIVKKLDSDGNFTADVKHNVIVKAVRPKKEGSKRIHGFVLSVTPDVGYESCGKGTFKLKNNKRATPATVKSGCHDMELDGSTDLKGTRGIQWIAPSCGCVTMSVEIKANDGMLYQPGLHDTETDLKYKTLIKKMCVKPTET